MYFSFIYFAPVVQGIGHKLAEFAIEVRVLAGAKYIKED